MNTLLVHAKDRFPYLLILPAVAFIALLWVYPLMNLLYLSTHKVILYLPASPFYGLRNFIEVLQLPDFKQILKNSFVWTFGCIGMQFAIGMSASLLLNQGYKGSSLFRTLLLTPWIVPGVVVGVIWGWIYDPFFGILNALLLRLSIPPPDWLGRPSTAMLSVIIANVWKGFPFWMIMISAGLQTIPHQLYEAAIVDGASAWNRFVYITLPGLRSVLTVASILGFIWTFNYFDLIYVLTKGGPANLTKIFPLFIYSTAFDHYNFGRAAAISISLGILMGVIIVIYMRITKFTEVK